MDTSYASSSPGSVSAEENHSQTAGPESREGQETSKRGTKRQEKNRDAARKSRRKQTERADELHEELQRLEQSNSALRKEIASLKKDYDLYTSALERHKPFCRVHDSASSPGSTTRLSPPVNRQASSSSSSPRAPHQTPASPHAAAPSQSTSSSVNLGRQIKSPHLAPSAHASSATVASSVGLFSSPNSLFAQDVPSLNPSGLTKAEPVRTPMAAALLLSPSNILSSHAARSCAIKVHQLPPGQFRGNHINSNPPRAFFKSALPNPSLPASTQANPESSPASGLSYSPHSRPSPTSLLSLLTTPSPLNVSQTTSSSFDGPPSQPLTSQPPQGDPLKDLSFTELLEGNDWILDPTVSGPTNQ